MLTPQESYPSLAKQFNLNELYLKREDLHPFGSHKGRSLPHMIDAYAEIGMRHFVISSSGNAALAAAMAIQAYNESHSQSQCTLQIFVGKRIPEKKLGHLLPYVDGKMIQLAQVDRPKQAAFQLDKQEEAVNLRQSTDPLALVGYQALAKELAEITHLDAVFVPSSSGTTAEALAKAFHQMNRKIQVHVVQTTACFPLVSAIYQAQKKDISLKKTHNSLAGAIVDHIAHRKKSVCEAILTQNGSGWIAHDDEITQAIQLVQQNTDLSLSPNSALSVAGLMHAQKQQWSFSHGIVACLITGV